LFFQHCVKHSFNLEDQVVNRAFTQVDLGMGVRVLQGDQTGYSFTEDLSRSAFLQAARTAAAIAAGGGSVSGPVSFTHRGGGNYYPIEVPWETVSVEKKIPFLQKINDRVFSRDRRVVKLDIGFQDETGYCLIANSEGRIVGDYQPMVRILINCTAEQDGRREQNHVRRSGRCGLEFCSTERIAELADEVVDRTVALFEARQPKGGEMEVVLAAGSSGILLHEAIGHGIEADFNRKRVSIFSDKINRAVAESFVSIVDDGTNRNLRGSINIDDEGNDSQKTYLVKDGILCSYLHDRISARHYGVAPTGNGRRQSFRYAPQPRMRNTYMLPGPHRRKEIIRSVKKGLYAETFTNGQVFIGAGDFTFYVKSGRLIEDGRLTRPVKDVNIIGNGPRVLRDIVMAADDFKIDDGGWTCGKNGQRVPVSLGLPTVKVSRITVGGV